jgi:hypothetical protein
MTSHGRSHERRNGEGHATDGQTRSVAQVTSHRDTAQRVRDANRFALQLPVVGRVPIPRPDQLAFYGALAALVAVELVDWPVAVAIGAGHALISRHSQQQEKNASDDEKQE